MHMQCKCRLGATDEGSGWELRVCLSPNVLSCVPVDVDCCWLPVGYNGKESLLTQEAVFFELLVPSVTLPMKWQPVHASCVNCGQLYNSQKGAGTAEHET